VEEQRSHRARGVNGKRRERPWGLCWTAGLLGVGEVRVRESQVRELG
jgi:hypothetical protein